MSMPKIFVLPRTCSNWPPHLFAEDYVVGSCQLRLENKIQKCAFTVSTCLWQQFLEIANFCIRTDERIIYIPQFSIVFTLPAVKTKQLNPTWFLNRSWGTAATQSYLVSESFLVMWLRTIEFVGGSRSFSVDLLFPRPVLTSWRPRYLCV